MPKQNSTTGLLRVFYLSRQDFCFKKTHMEGGNSWNILEVVTEVQQAKVPTFATCITRTMAANPMLSHVLMLQASVKCVRVCVCCLYLMKNNSNPVLGTGRKSLLVKITDTSQSASTLADFFGSNWIRVKTTEELSYFQKLPQDIKELWLYKMQWRHFQTGWIVPKNITSAFVQRCGFTERKKKRLEAVHFYFQEPDTIITSSKKWPFI